MLSLSVLKKDTQDIRQELLSSVGFHSKVNKTHEVLSEGRTVSMVEFEKVKELLKEAIDEGNTIAEIMQITAEKIYQQGVKDGEQE